MQDLEAQLAVVTAALSVQGRLAVLTLFKAKMLSSYRNGYKAGIARAEHRTIDVVPTEERE